MATGKSEMKYHCGLNNVRPCGKCSPCAARIAFISIPFTAPSLLLRRGGGVGAPLTDPQNRSKMSLATNTFNSIDVFCIFLPAK